MCTCCDHLSLLGDRPAEQYPPVCICTSEPWLSESVAAVGATTSLWPNG
jgi:hypothetical protein